MSEKGNVFIVSAPSGSGKSTLVANLLGKVPGLTFSVSYTTRKPRGNEKDGKEYFFVSELAFEKMIQEDQFLEYARVFGYYYGTAKSAMQQAFSEGKDLVLDIDTEGAAQVRNRLPQAVSIFIMPPSYEALKSRLENRKQDSQETIFKRLHWASHKEIHRYKSYDYVVINEDLSQSFELMRSIICSERCRTNNMTHRVESIIKTFGGI
jgi:guanylate kinase